MDRWLELPKLPGTLGRCPLACLRGPPSPRDTTRLDVRWASLMALDRSMLRSLSTPAPDAGKKTHKQVFLGSECKEQLK